MIQEGDLASAQTEAAAAAARFSSQGAEWAWKFRLEEGEALAYRGLNQDAVHLLKPALPPSLAGGDLSVQRGMVLGLAYARLGQFRESDQEFKQAQQTCERAHSNLAGELARARGSAELERDQFAAADSYYRESLQYARDTSDRFLEVTDLMNIGRVALMQEHYDEAITWFTSASDAAKAMNARQIVAKVIGNLGWAYYKIGDTEQSLALFTEAEKKSGDLGFVIDQMKWLDTIGLIHYQREEYQTAESFYRRSLQVAQQTGSREGVVNADVELAFVLLEEGRLDRAQHYSEAAITLAHENQDHASELRPMLAQGRIAFIRAQDDNARKIFLDVAADPQSELDLHWQAEHQLARLDEHEHRTLAAEQQYRKALAVLEGARETLHHEELKLPFLANASSVYDDYIHFLLSQSRPEEALAAAEYSRARTLSEGLGLLRPNAQVRFRTADAKRAAQRAGCPILFYWLGHRDSYLWVITPRRAVLFPLPPAQEIKEVVERYDRALQNARDPIATENADGRALFRMLIAPERSLIGDAPRVVVIPDGPLNKLNFETLLDDSPSTQYWIEDATISYASSLRLLSARQESSRNSGNNLLIIGDAIPPGPDYPPLPNAAREVDSVARQFPADRLHQVLRESATAGAYFQSQPYKFEYIHFVAHATASEMSPLDSAIILSRKNGDADSAKLYARDILKLPLHADLVTISTCYGASGRTYIGEGLVGLSWSFLRAGAHHVIGALWEVNDTSTPQLMSDLYAGIESGQAPESALRSAKLAMLHSSGVYRKPFYWAPFQLYTGL